MTLDERKSFNRLRRIIAYLMIAMMFVVSWINNLYQDLESVNYDKEIALTVIKNKSQNENRLYRVIDSLKKAKPTTVIIEAPKKKKKVLKDTTKTFIDTTILKLPHTDSLKKVDSL